MFLTKQVIKYKIYLDDTDQLLTIKRLETNSYWDTKLLTSWNHYLLNLLNNKFNKIKAVFLEIYKIT